MADYLTTDELGYFQLSAADTSAEKKAFAITAASRYFDRLSEVEDDFFQVAESESSEKVIQGNGLSILSLPPFVGDLGDVVLDETVIDPTSYLIKGKSPNQYLVYPTYGGVDWGYSVYAPWFRYGAAWTLNQPYTISARWGWSAIPYDVKAGVAEIAIALCSALDVARALTLEESFAKLPMVVPNGFADRASRYYRERLAPIGI